MDGRLVSISISDNISFSKSVDVLNRCFGKNYAGWQRAFLVLSENEAVWFPKIAVIEGGIAKAQDKVYGCVNTVSEDGMYIEERNSIACGKVENIKRYVFAKADRKSPYKYIGTFVKDMNMSANDKAVYKRVEEDIDLRKWN